VEADNFSLDALIRSMKDLKGVELGSQVRAALESAAVPFDTSTLSALVDELENDLEEHIARLETICGVLNDEERRRPETMSAERRREVAVASSCDLEEVESLCDAFSRARKILSSIAHDGEGQIDVKLLFGNLASLSGLDIGATDEKGEPLMISSNFFRKLLVHKVEERADDEVTELVVPEGEEFDSLFDLERTSEPRNRLPKDWNP